jgi:hypothetical protein
MLSAWPASPPSRNLGLDLRIAGLRHLSPQALPLHALADLVHIERNPQPPGRRRRVHISHSSLAEGISGVRAGG